MQAWIEAETKGADFGDQRLNHRYELLLDRLKDICQSILARFGISER